MDRYSKFVLTVIAASLAVIALKMPMANNAMAFGDGCGSRMDPCYVDSSSPLGMSVFVRN